MSNVDASKYNRWSDLRLRIRRIVFYCMRLDFESAAFHWFHIKRNIREG